MRIHRVAGVALAVAVGLLPGSAGAGGEAPSPDSVARLETGRSLIEQGRFEQARDHMRPLLEAHPDWARARFYLAMSYYAEKRWEPALRQYEAVVRLAPEFDEARRMSGWCRFYLGDVDGARADFATYLQDVPDSADAFYGLGLIELDEDRVEAARAGFERAGKLARQSGDTAQLAQVHERLAEIWLRRDEPRRAVQELVLALRYAPDRQRTWFRLSRALQRLGDDEGARLARERDPAALERLPPPREEDG